MSTPLLKPERSRKVIAGLVAFIALVFIGSMACGHTPASSSPSTSTSSISANTPDPFDQNQKTTRCSAQCHSTLFPAVVFPDGSYQQGPDNDDPDLAVEVWHIPLGTDEAAANLRSQLPINAPAVGLPWCQVDTNTKLNTTTWSWETAQQTLTVDLSPHFIKTGIPGTGSDVSITKGKNTDGTVQCGSATAVPTGTAPPPVPGDPLKSKLLNVEMPDGSTFESGRGADGQYTGQEFWLVPGSVKDVSAAMVARLPIDGPLGGLPWCRADIDPHDEEPTWQWRSPGGDLLTDSMTVDVMKSDQDSVIRVMITAETASNSDNRTGCS